MPFTRASGGKQISAEKTFPHRALPTAYPLYHPLQVLAGRQAELKLDLMKKMKRVGTGGTEAVARHLDEIVKVSFMNPRSCRRAAAP
jgi:hypothetical protein